MKISATIAQGKLLAPAPHLNLSPKPFAMSPQIHISTGIPRQIQHGLPSWRRDVISQRPPSIFAHGKQLAGIIVALGVLFWLSFGLLTHHAPPASYPYYDDTQKPLLPWSEPTPLPGNRDGAGEHR